ncbi:MAG: ROK family protein [Monoglobus pectinilyticus]|uniref:ROK family protein n=1 Tax=Monoglobus pectinilyticus TaxID=1981510 RepID=UPI00399A7876
MYLGIDLGGTNIAAGIVNKNGEILKKLSCPTLPGRPFDEIIGDMAELCSNLLSISSITEDEIKAIGIGSPGAIDNKNGVVLYAGNLNWTNAAICDELNKYYNIPINLENDANAAAYGEYAMCGKKVKDFIFITLGTGIGGGIIIDGKIYRGFNGAGAEVGHSTLVFNGEKCTCGRKGCCEAYGSVTALIRQTSRSIMLNQDSLMAKSYKETGEINGKTAFDAAKAGDINAQTVVKQYIEYVADGICSLVNIFEPELLLIGGGISKEGGYLLNPIKEYCEKNYFCKNIRQTEIGIAVLGNDAGIIGAALSARDSLK